MSREVFRAWLSGILEGRDVPASVIDKVFAKIEQVYGTATGPQAFAAPTETPAATPMPPSIDEMKTLYPPNPDRHEIGKQPGRRPRKLNSTPVASAPPEDDDPENPTVVRLG